MISAHFDDFICRCSMFLSVIPHRGICVELEKKVAFNLLASTTDDVSHDVSFLPSLMSPRRNSSRTRTRTQRIEKSSPPEKAGATETTSEIPVTKINVYRGFTQWKSKKTPPWHPVKKMRYVFWRMMHGDVILDALKQIHWDPREFWPLVNDSFLDEYKVAKQWQSRALADTVKIIAEGRDPITKKSVKKTLRIIKLAMKKIHREKSRFGQRMALQQLLNDLREHDKVVMTRNKMQIDAAKWIASKGNPGEFGERTHLGIHGFPAGTGETNTPIAITFIAPDGSEVPFDPTGGRTRDE